MITVDSYTLLTDCIDQGLLRGLRRMFKHDSSPKDEDAVIANVDRILNDIMVEVCEYFRFDDDEIKEKE